MFRNVLAVSVLMLSAGAAYAATDSLSAVPGSFKVADVRDVVHDEASGTIVHSSSGACVRTQWMQGYDECGTAVAPPPPVHKQVSLSREERTVYFGFNQASLSSEMKGRLDTLASALRSNEDVHGARIVGYADRIGNAGYNEKLSKKRAEVVRQYLVSKGIINTQVADTKWLGSSDPVTSCPANLKRPDLINCLAKDRRVEVEIDYAPEQTSAR